MPKKTATAVDWQALLRDFRSSGLTHAEFCRRRGVSLHAFHRHLYAPTPATPDAAPTRFPIAPGFDPATLRRLLATLEGQP